MTNSSVFILVKNSLLTLQSWSLVVLFFQQAACSFMIAFSDSKYPRRCLLTIRFIVFPRHLKRLLRGSWYCSRSSLPWNMDDG